MTTTLSPVTESEMNQFFHGLNEFKGRIATSIVAHSEQVQRIDDLTKVVYELQSQVQALTNTIRQLTEDRDQARAERDRAVASERVALDMAQEAERKLTETLGNCEEQRIVIGTLQETKFHLEVSNAELKEQNDRQTFTLQQSIEDNQRLQELIKQLKEENVRWHTATNNAHDDCKALENEVQRLTNLLLGARAVLEGTDCPPRREQAA